MKRIADNVFWKLTTGQACAKNFKNISFTFKNDTGIIFAFSLMGKMGLRGVEWFITRYTVTVSKSDL